MGQKPRKPATAARPLLRRIHDFDNGVSLYIHTLTRPIAPRPVLRLLELLADFRFFFPVSLSLFLAAPSSSPLRSHLLLPLLLCSLLDLLFVALLKFLVRRSRPSYADHAEYSAVVSVDNFSFPSGHSSRVCFVASVLSLSRPWILADLNRPRVAIGGGEVLTVDLLIAAVWAWALTTAVSRVALGRHYVIDVCCGACFGVLEALFTFRVLQFRGGTDAKTVCSVSSEDLKCIIFSDNCCQNMELVCVLSISDSHFARSETAELCMSFYICHLSDFITLLQTEELGRGIQGRKVTDTMWKSKTVEEFQEMKTVGII
ncbi:lipid phosphate phosphatase beta [Spatholobus suberectus]|nr:lipid phosphate phosphatase beta [Spatholobus suberectus]